MAVDTAEKRFSMLNFGDGTNVHLLFQFDGAVDLDDRQHLLDCYSGVAFSAPLIVIDGHVVLDRIYITPAVAASAVTLGPAILGDPGVN